MGWSAVMNPDSVVSEAENLLKEREREKEEREMRKHKTTGEINPVTVRTCATAFWIN